MYWKDQLFQIKADIKASARSVQKHDNTDAKVEGSRQPIAADPKLEEKQRQRISFLQNTPKRKKRKAKECASRSLNSGLNNSSHISSNAASRKDVNCANNRTTKDTASLRNKYAGSTLSMKKKSSSRQKSVSDSTVQLLTASHGKAVHNPNAVTMPTPVAHQSVLDYEKLVKIDTAPSDLVSNLLAAPSQELKFTLPNTDPSRRKKALVIGLDFGTAFTKVVVGDITYAYAIPFGKYGYLLPSQLYIDKNGNSTLEKIDVVETLNNLKLSIILSQATDCQYFAVINFLSLVLSYTRKWVSEQVMYADVNIDWQLNVGLPAVSCDNKSLVSLYKRIVTAAWTLSYADNINLSSAKQCWEQEGVNLPDALKLMDYNLNVFPEFIGQIVGYVQSPARRNYSHLLIDVGAGTLDVVFFTVKQENGEWHYQTYGKDVKSLGVDILFQHRLSSLELNGVSFDNSRYPSDKEFVNLFSLSTPDLIKLDKSFNNAVARCISKVLRDSDQNYCGGAQGHFSEPISTFLCGGGAAFKCYANVLGMLPPRYPLNVLRLPIPKRLNSKGVDSNLFQRLSVAYGLSFDSLNIGNVSRKQRDRIAPVGMTDSYNPSAYLLQNGD
ncbi:MAG: hypothetical protein ACRCVP_14585 [Shewanella xiamenensis]